MVFVKYSVKTEPLVLYFLFTDIPPIPPDGWDWKSAIKISLFPTRRVGKREKLFLNLNDTLCIKEKRTVYP